MTIDDARMPTGWANGARPRSLAIEYDALHRTTSVVSTYAGGGDGFVSPFAPEVADGDSSPIPRQQASSRGALQTYDYDSFGNLTSTTDDQNILWDRSLGPIVNSPLPGVGGGAGLSPLAAGMYAQPTTKPET